MPRTLAVSLITLLALGILCAGSTRADERIHDFHSDIVVAKDGSLRVTETITVTAEGQKIKRGVYRDFPTIYKSRYLMNVAVPFQVVSVQRDGMPDGHRIEQKSNGVRVYIGREDHQLPRGKYTYEITYTTDYQLGYFDQHDELYWNVTSNGWEFPIDRAAASVKLPPDVPRDAITHEGYTGPEGSKEANLTSKVNEATGNVEFAATDRLPPGSGLTIVVGFPKGHVREPTQAERRQLYYKANRTLWLVLGGLLTVLIYYLFAWFAVGRDPPGDVIYPRFEPPLGLAPASLRYLRLMGYDKKCFTAALLNMAVKKHLSIKEEEGEFTLVRNSVNGQGKLSSGERGIADSLLQSPYVKLKQSNHQKIGKAIEKLGERLSQECDGKLFLKNRWWLAPGWLLSAGAIAVVALSLGGEAAGLVGILSVWLSFWTLGCVMLLKQAVAAWRSALALRRNTLGQVGSYAGALFITAFATPFLIAEVVVLGLLVFQTTIWMVPLLLGLITINWLFWHWIKQPTIEGQRIRDGIEGFRMYLSTAEGEYLSRIHPPRETPELFEKYLPYALALDVENEWSEKFSDVLAQAAASPGRSGGYHPGWYHGSHWNSAAVGAFAGGLGSSLGGAISASSTAPGSSSGGGGGGSSGGGGGGGGGGGW